jgi:hypothetical protein
VSSNQNIPREDSEPNSISNNKVNQPPPSLTEQDNLPPNPAINLLPSTNDQTTPPMEVHHHGHVHEKKKWKEYIFQFLMLFLAVTAGFFVENQREHYIEHKRAKEFARLLLDDLIMDTSELNRAHRAWQNIVIASDSLSILMQPTSAEIAEAKLYYYEYWSGWRWNVISRDATLQQLKNSGSLRYFGNVSLIRKILDYEEAIKLTYLLQTRFDTEKAQNWTLVQKVFNQSVFDTLEKIKGAGRDSATDISIHNTALEPFFKRKFSLNNYDQATLSELKNWAENTSRNYRILLKDIPYTKQKAINAIDALKNQYNLE